VAHKPFVKAILLANYSSEEVDLAIFKRKPVEDVIDLYGSDSESDEELEVESAIDRELNLFLMVIKQSSETVLADWWFAHRYTSIAT
jgi:hypothetical protein